MCHIVEVGGDVAVPQEEALWEVVEVGGEDVGCEEVGEFVLGAGSVKLEDGLPAVQLVEEDGAVVFGFGEGGLNEVFAEGDGPDGRAEDAEPVCDFCR